MKKFLILLSLFAVIVMSCSKSQDKTTSQQQDKTTQSQGDEKKIGVVVSTLNNPFFVDLVEGAKQQAAALGYKLIVLDSQNDPAKELSNVEDLITNKVDLVILNPSDSDASVRSGKSCQDAGIPIITVDRSINDFKSNAHIASDNVSGGKIAAQYIVDILGSGQPVVELEGVPGSSAARERGYGFNMNKELNVVLKQVANFDRVQGLNVMENIIQTGTDFKAVFAHNDEMALGALKALESAGKNDVIVVGFDAIDDAKEAIKAGKMSATIAQKPKEIGKTAIDVAKLILSGTVPQDYYPVELEVIQKQ